MIFEANSYRQPSSKMGMTYDEARKKKFAYGQDFWASKGQIG